MGGSRSCVRDSVLHIVLTLILSSSLFISLPTPTDRLITSKDHASIQISIADVNEEGVALKTGGTTIALCGQVRSQGEADDSINRLATKAGGELGSKHVSACLIALRGFLGCEYRD